MMDYMTEIDFESPSETEEREATQANAMDWVYTPDYVFAEMMDIVAEAIAEMRLNEQADKDLRNTYATKR